MTLVNNTNSEIESTEDYEDLPIKDSELNDKRRKLKKHDKQVIWRRQSIFNLLVRGVTSTYQIAETMKISEHGRKRPSILELQSNLMIAIQRNMDAVALEVFDANDEGSKELLACLHKELSDVIQSTIRKWNTEDNAN